MTRKFAQVCLAALAVLLALGALAAADFESASRDQAVADQFAAYVATYGKAYATAAERAQRQALFAARLAAVEAHNSRAVSLGSTVASHAASAATWHAGINHLSDRTPAELRALLGRRPVAASVARVAPAPVPHQLLDVDVSGLPKHVDWREAGVVTPPKDQGQCGSCWSFAAAETVESHWAIKTGQLAVLSEQQILDCTPNPDECGGTGGCHGATVDIAFARIIKMGGLSSEWTYSYQSYWGNDFKQCRFSTSQTPVAAAITDYVMLPTNEEPPLLAAVAKYGPVAISVDATNWSPYAGGVFNGCDQDSPVINHAVQLVGYGVDPKLGKYYTVRNSWGAAWGESGFIRIARPDTISCGNDTKPLDGTACKGGPAVQYVCGTCGILFDNVFPIVGNSATKQLF